MAGLQPKTITRGKTFVLNTEYPPAEVHKLIELASIEIRIDNGTDRGVFDPTGILATSAGLSAAVSATNTHTARTDNPHTVTKAQVGLGNCDNTSDANKPVSSAGQAALDLKAADNAVVKLTESQTVAGVKTFSSSPVVPTPAVENDSTAAANTAWVRLAVAAILEDTMIDRGFKTFDTNGTWTHPKPGTTISVLIKAVGGGGGGANTGTGGNGGNTVVSKAGLTVTARGGYGHGVSGSPHHATKGFPLWGAVMGPLGIGIYGGGGWGPSGNVGQSGEGLCVAVETDGDLTIAIGAAGTAGLSGATGQAGYVVLEW